MHFITQNEESSQPSQHACILENRSLIVSFIHRTDVEAAAAASNNMNHQYLSQNFLISIFFIRASSFVDVFHGTRYSDLQVLNWF